MKTQNKNIGYFLLILIGVLGLLLLIFLEPIKQSQAYHDFSDNQAFSCVSNFWNVMSNIPFLIIGVWGMLKLDSIAKNKLHYFILFLGIALISIGSGYYHLNPNDSTLIWDRLPMTIALMSLFSIVISEFVSYSKGKLILFPTLTLGVFSVLYWSYSGDLKLYILVQSLPILAMPVILVFFNSKYTLTYGYWLLLITYLVAKLFEYYDNQIYEMIGTLGGHPLKHFMASVGLAILLYTYIKRDNVSLNN